MEDLIEALQILSKYGNPEWPTHCGHDVLYVDIDPELVSDEDTKRLDELGFFPSDEGMGDTFMSYKFGSY